MRSKNYGWSNVNLNLTKEFNEGNFEKLFEYADANKLNLMNVWLRGDGISIRNVLRLGTSLLNHFRLSIASGDSENLAAFKLGELSGYLACLNCIQHENHQNDFAKDKLDSAKSWLPENPTYFEEVIKLLYSNGILSAQELLDKGFSFNLSELEIVLQALVENQLVFCSKLNDNYYSIADMGIRLAHQLTDFNDNSKNSHQSSTDKK